MYWQNLSSSYVTSALWEYYVISKFSFFNHLCSSITFIIIWFFDPGGCPDRASFVNLPKIALLYFIRIKPGLSSKFFTMSISRIETSNISSLNIRNLQIIFVSVRMIYAKLKDALISLTQHRPVYDRVCALSMAKGNNTNGQNIFDSLNSIILHVFGSCM